MAVRQTGGTLVVSLMGIFRIFKLFGRQKKSDSPSESNVKKEFEQIHKNLNYFQYTDNGFTITIDEKSLHISWDSITRIDVYKKDQLVTDLICMDIFFDEKFITIHEELPGWFEFTLKTKEIFPSIPKEWDIDIIQPPFATNLSTIYKK